MPPITRTTAMSHSRNANTESLPLSCREGLTRIRRGSLVLDDVNGGLLGGRGAVVDADVLGGELVAAHQPTGAAATDLVVVRQVGGVVVRVDVRLLLLDPLVDRLPVLLLPGRVAVALGGRPLLGRGVAPVERVGHVTV